MGDDFDRKRDIEAEGQRAAIYHAKRRQATHYCIDCRGPHCSVCGGSGRLSARSEPQVGHLVDHNGNVYEVDIPEPVEAQGDGWRDWKGGECPVPEYAFPWVRYRSGGNTQEQANRIRWNHTGAWDDVLAYRYRLTPQAEKGA